MVAKEYSSIKDDMHALLNPAQRICQERISHIKDIALVVHLYKGIGVQNSNLLIASVPFEKESSS